MLLRKKSNQMCSFGCMRRSWAQSERLLTDKCELRISEDCYQSQIWEERIDPLSRKRAVSRDYVQHRPAKHMNVARLLYEGFGFQLRSWITCSSNRRCPGFYVFLHNSKGWTQRTSAFLNKCSAWYSVATQDMHSE